MEITPRQLQDMTGGSLQLTPKPDDLMLATHRLDPAAGDNQALCPGRYEYFSVFDAVDQPLTIAGRQLVCYRAECHGPGRIPGLFHRSAVVWILDREDRLLLPTRSPTKDLNGGLLSVSMGEHNKVGESYLQAALRGGQEELGLVFRPADLTLVTTLPLRAPEQWQITQYFVYRVDDQEKDALVLDPDEFTDQRWFARDLLLRVDPVQSLGFRPDQGLALQTFLGQLQAGNLE